MICIYRVSHVNLHTFFSYYILSRYGDLVPTTNGGKLFSVLFSFAGIGIVGAYLGYIGVTLIDAERKAIQNTQNMTRTKLMGLFHPLSKYRRFGTKRKERRDRLIRALQNRRKRIGDSSFTAPLRVLYTRLFAIREQIDGTKSILRRVWDVLAETYYIFVPFVSLAMYIGKSEAWSPIQSIYYAMITATTVGYGDCSPSSPKMRLVSLALAFIPLAVISLGEVLTRVAGYFIRRETTKVQHDFMNRKMTMKDLEEMDTNGDGEVDLFEFISFMLSKMQMVDVELMNELKDLFESLDETCSNSIQKEDLLLIAQIRDWRGKED